MQLTKFEGKPLIPHLNAMKQILRYLNGTLSHGLVLKPLTQLSLQGFGESN